MNQLGGTSTFHLNWIFLQEALAIAFETEESRIGNPDCYFSLLSKQMEQKRNELSTYLSDAGLQPITPGGGYFIVADISSIGITIIAYAGSIIVFESWGGAD